MSSSGVKSSWSHTCSSKHTREEMRRLARGQGRARGDPECTKTVWRIPKTEARKLGLKKRTVFRACPSKRAKRRARRGKAQLAAGNLPGGDDKVLAGFQESSVTKSGYLWSAVTYDDAGSPTRSVMKTAESTLIFAERAPVAAAASTTGKRSRRRRRRRSPGSGSPPRPWPPRASGNRARRETAPTHVGPSCALERREPEFLVSALDNSGASTDLVHTYVWRQ